MAGGKILGITIDIEGKSDKLVSSLKDAQTALNKTTSSLKDVNSALKLDPSNVELMAQKQTLLTKAIDETEQKLAVMKQVALDASEGLKEGTVSQESYASLTAEISKTEQSLNALKAEAEGTGDSMGEVEDGADGAGDELAEMGEEAESSGAGLEALKATAIAVGAEMVASFAACVKAIKEVGGALIDMSISGSDAVDELNTLSAQTGLTTETLQEMQYVSGLIDVDVSTMTGSMTKLEKAMNSAKDGTGSSAEAFDKLGISIKNSDGSFRDNEEVFWDMIDALGKIEDPVERDIIAMETMGKSAKDLNPLILAGSDAYKELAQEAHEVGAVMGEETLDAYQQFDDQMERLNKGADAAKNALGTIMLPMLEDLASTGTSAINQFTKVVYDADGDIDKIGDAVSDLLPDIFQSINKNAPKIFKLIGQVVNSLLQIFIDNLPEFCDTALSIITALAETLINPENITKIANAATTIIMSLLNYLIMNLDKVLSAALSIVQSLLQGLQENLPILIPAAIDAILTFCETLLAPENLSMLLDAVLQIVLAVSMAILDDLPTIIESLITVITNIVTWLLSPEGIGRIAEAGFELFVGLIQKLPEILISILGGVGDICSGVLDAFGGLKDSVLDIWDKIWDGIKVVINFIIGGLNMFVSAIESAVNFFIDGINLMIDGMNDLVGWIPGVPSDLVPNMKKLAIPSIPYLAEGAVIGPNNPFLAVLGDQTNGTNVEAPLETIKQALAEVLGGGSGGDMQIVVPVYIGDEKLDTVVAHSMRNINYIGGGR